MMYVYCVINLNFSHKIDYSLNETSYLKIIDMLKTVFVIFCQSFKLYNKNIFNIIQIWICLV